MYYELKETIPCVEFVCDIPENINEKYFDVGRNNVLLLDDMMTACNYDDRISNLFSVGSHHKSLGSFYLTPNLFNQGKEMRKFGLNTHYLIVFNNPRDNQHVWVVAE